MEETHVRVPTDNTLSEHVQGVTTTTVKTTTRTSNHFHDGEEAFDVGAAVQTGKFDKFIWVREYAAEMMGCMILVFLGFGSNTPVAIAAGDTSGNVVTNYCINLHSVLILQWAGLLVLLSEFMSRPHTLLDTSTLLLH